MPDPTATDQVLDAYLEPRREERLERLKAFLRIPSISALPQHAPDVRRAAEWLADEMRTAGIENVEVSETGGHPMVYGDWLHAEGAPTVLVYGHYDVQPVDPLAEWRTDPFEPVVDGHRLIGRGTADDKGQIHAHISAAAALLATRDGLPVNVKYVFEGEEESGSAHLEAWLAEHRDRLDGDAAIISDTGFFEGNVPAITLSLRGMTYAQIDVRLADGDLHSGSYGGAIGNPAFAIAQIIAALKGPDGRIRIPGFYDDVREPTQAERDAIAALPFDEEVFRDRHGGFQARRRSRLHDTRAEIDPPDARCQRDLGRVPGPRSEDDHPCRGTREDQHASRRRPGAGPTSSRSSRRSSRRSRRQASRSPSGCSARADRARPRSTIRMSARHPKRSSACSEQPPLYINSGGSIPVAASFQSILGLPVVLARLHPAQRPGTCAERVVRPGQLRAGDPDDRRHVRRDR